RRAGASPAIYAMTIDQCKWPTLQHVSSPAANASASELHKIRLVHSNPASTLMLTNYRYSGGRVGCALPSSFRFQSSLPSRSAVGRTRPVASWNQRLIFSFSRKVWSIVKRLAILGNFLQANDGGKIMIHLIWYILVGLIAGVIAKSVMHVHMTIFWT